MKNTTELMHCQCGTNNRAPRQKKKNKLKATYPQYGEMSIAFYDAHEDTNFFQAEYSILASRRAVYTLPNSIPLYKNNVKFKIPAQYVEACRRKKGKTVYIYIIFLVPKKGITST